MSHLHIVFSDSRGTINPNIYGHFSEHIGGVFYDGLWVGEDSPIENIRGFRKALVDSFRKLHPPVLRWPCGCFAECYDWRDGIGPRAKRPTRVNWWYSNDGRTESNQVGTHEFMDFCRMVGAEPYFAANMAAATPLHIRDWVEYCNFPGGTTLSQERQANGAREPFGVKYWGIGNENWGGGGQMSPEMCAREFIRYTTIINSIGRGTMKFIMCGPNGDDSEWTRRLMKEWSARQWQEAATYGMSLHYYCGTAGMPTDFSEAEWYQLLHQANRMQRILDNQRAAMHPYDLADQVGIIVDEWGCWHKEGTGPSHGRNLFEQQSAMRDAVVSALTLNIFNNRCDSVVMANVAQLVNNLHSLYLTAGDQFVETPNYHVFDMYKGHQGARQLRVINDSKLLTMADFPAMPTLSVSASEAADGSILATIANLSYDREESVTLSGIDGLLNGMAEVTVLRGEHPQDCNDFEHPDRVRPVTVRQAFADGTEIVLPAASVTAIHICR